MIQLEQLKRATNNKSEQVAAKITKPLKQRLATECTKENITVSALIEALLTEWIKSRDNEKIMHNGLK